MNNTKYEKLLSFVQFTHLFQQVKRSVYATGEDRLENDAEHSYQMALVGWYIISTENLPFNLEKVFKYILAHDLVEAYAGDTPNFGNGIELKESKHLREQDALKLIQERYSEFPVLHETIESYEKQQDPEGRFVYALDKLISPLNIYLDNGRSWHKNKVSLEELIENKKKRLSIDPTILDIFNNFIENVKGKPFLFS